MKKLISFSLYGQSDVYQIGAIKNAELVRRLYPGWVSRFYVSTEIPTSVTDALRDNGAEVIVMRGGMVQNGTFWRFFAVSDPQASHVVLRDADARLTTREYDAVNEWLESGRSFHIMRDHPYHRTAIMGGMWGARGGVIVNIKLRILLWMLKCKLYGRSGLKRYGCDQLFLLEEIYPMTRGDALVHSEYVRYDNESIHDFPTPARKNEFVGQSRLEHDRFEEILLETRRNATLIHEHTEAGSFGYLWKKCRSPKPYSVKR